MALVAAEAFKSSFKALENNMSPLDEGKAERSLKRLGLDVTAESIKVFLALRQHKDRVNEKDMARASKMVADIEEDFLLKRVYLIQKTLLPNLDKQLSCRWLVPVDSLKRFPNGVSRDDVWVIDSGIDRSREKEVIAETAGILEWHSKVGEIRSSDPTHQEAISYEPTRSLPSSASRPALDNCSAVSVLPVSVVPGTAASQKPKKLLKHTDSDAPMEQEEDPMELAAQEAKTAADKNRWFVEDKSCPDTFEYWCRFVLTQMKQHKNNQEAQTTMPAHFKQFTNFEIETLLNTPSYPFIKVFAKDLEEKQALFPDKFPKVGVSIITLSTAPLDGDAEMALEGLSDGKARMFRGSELNYNYIWHRHAFQFRQLRDQSKDMSPDMAYLKIVALYEKAGTPSCSKKLSLVPEQAEELLIMKTVLGDSPLSAKIFYLADPMTRLDVVEAWIPNHETLAIRPFLKKRVDWATIAVDACMHGARLLAKCPEAMDKIPSSAAKPIVTVFLKVDAEVKNRVNEQEQMDELVKRIMSELCMVKLQVVGSLVSNYTFPWNEHTELAKALHKILGSAALQLAEEKFGKESCSVLVSLAQKIVEFAPAPPTLATESAPLVEQKLAQNLAVVAPAGQSQRGPQDDTSKSSAEFVVGARVRIDMKRKQEWHGRSAKVVKVGKSGVKVEMEDKEGQFRAFENRNLVLESPAAGAQLSGNPAANASVPASSTTSAPGPEKAKVDLAAILGNAGESVDDSD